MLSWKFRDRGQGKKMKVFKRNAFANQLASIVETDSNTNYDDDTSMEGQKEQNQPLVRILPSGTLS